MVDWECFRRRINRQRSFGQRSCSALDDAVAYLLAHPPKAQRLAHDGKTIEWEPLGISDGDGELWRLLLIVRTVRNNLFHGGKYPYVDIDEVARDAALLGHSMTVVEALVDCDDEVALFYDEAAKAWADPPTGE